MGCVAKGEYALFSPTFFFIAARPTKGHIKLVMIKGLFKPLRLGDVCMQGTAML